MLHIVSTVVFIYIYTYVHLMFRLVLSGASAGAPFVASPCVFFCDF